jgi:alpha-amylase
MPGKVTFILGIHNHQPVGNFDHVIEEAYERAYLPFIEVMKEFPRIPFALHCSGILWDWFAERHPDYTATLVSMVEEGKVEIMSGGYYEPILTVIPERDRQGQLSMMRDFIDNEFGSKPRGCWLTERIWDPHLPYTLARAGLEYVIVDDSHFKSTGFTEQQMRGFFLSEENGAYINVFPIDKTLRYLIPFHEPHEVIEYLRAISEEEGDCRKVAVLADDGEKFGLWTGTHDLVYRRHWLRRFCEALMENSDWLEVSTFSKVVDETPPRGIVYLPTASYSEMMEWALPLRAQEQYQEAKGMLAGSGQFPDAAEIVRGGFWRNFLVKYEEANWMHKRMLRASTLLNGSSGGDEEARSHLYQAQCNCAYWHGLFGGLYLPHLRSAVFRHIIEAEAVSKRSAIERVDLDGDGIEEVILSSPRIQAFFKARGGVMRELDDMGARFNLTDTLTRREEIYHRELKVLGRKAGETAGAVSIHDLVTAKEEGLEKRLVYDRWPKASLSDRFMPADTSLEMFAAGSYEELGDFVDGLYEVEIEGDDLLVMSRNGRVAAGGDETPVSIEKRISLDGEGAGIKVEYSIGCGGGGLSCLFAVENVFSFLAGNAPDRFFDIPGRKLGGGAHLASRGVEEDVGILRIVDEWLNIEVSLELDPAAEIWRYPIETVSNSDSGFERVYQGSAVAGVMRLDLVPGDIYRFTLSIGCTAAGRS